MLPRIGSVPLALAAVVLLAAEPARPLERGAMRTQLTSVRPAPAQPPSGEHLVAHIRRGAVVPLRLRPAGRVVARLRDRTEFGSPQRVAVVRRRGSRWLGVTTPAVSNGRLAWIEARATRIERVHVAIEVDLSRRELRLLRGGEIVGRLRVAVGRAGSRTPVGRFHVTDKLRGAHYGEAYGCCILALSGRQTRLPPGWVGGDRLAIHGTPRPDLVGRAVSAGCLHARRAALRYLMRTVPLGTPVFIRA